MKRYDEAEAAWRKTIEIDPSYVSAYCNLGVLLEELKRYDEAEAAYRTAIERNPSYANAYHNLALLLRLHKREAEALTLLEKLVSLRPGDFNTYLAMASIKKMLGQSIPSEYIDKARQLMPEDQWYNRACLESVSGNIDQAFEHLAKAVQVEDFDNTWVWEDPDLQWLRDDARFVEIVGPKPEE